MGWKIDRRFDCMGGDCFSGTGVFFGRRWRFRRGVVLCGGMLVVMMMVVVVC